MRQPQPTLVLMPEHLHPIVIGLQKMLEQTDIFLPHAKEQWYRQRQYLSVFDETLVKKPARSFPLLPQ